MDGWLIRVILMALGFGIAWLWVFANDIVVTNKQFKDACERATERERMKMLTYNSNINEILAKIDKMEVKVEPAETAQPVSEPSPADLVLNTVKEDKW